MHVRLVTRIIMILLQISSGESDESALSQSATLRARQNCQNSFPCSRALWGGCAQSLWSQAGHDMSHRLHFERARSWSPWILIQLLLNQDQGLHYICHPIVSEPCNKLREYSHNIIIQYNIVQHTGIPVHARSLVPNICLSPAKAMDFFRIGPETRRLRAQVCEAQCISKPSASLRSTPGHCCRPPVHPHIPSDWLMAVPDLWATVYGMRASDPIATEIRYRISPVANMSLFIITRTSVRFSIDLSVEERTWLSWISWKTIMFAFLSIYR
jgi:hypothetical protein